MGPWLSGETILFARMQLSLNSGRLRVEDRALPTRWLRREQGTLTLHVWGKNTKQVCDEVVHKWKMQNVRNNWRQSSFNIITHRNLPDKWCKTFYLSRPSLPSGFSTPGGLGVPRCVLTRAYTYIFGIAVFIKGALKCTFFQAKQACVRTEAGTNSSPSPAQVNHSFNTKYFPHFFVMNLPVCSTFSLFQARLESQLCFTL